MSIVGLFCVYSRSLLCLQYPQLTPPQTPPHDHLQAARVAEGSFIFLSLHVLLCCAGLSPQREGEPPRHTDITSTTTPAAAAAASASSASMPVGASCKDAGAAAGGSGSALNPEWELVEGGGGQADWELVDEDCPAADDYKVCRHMCVCICVHVPVVFSYHRLCGMPCCCRR